MMPQIVPIVNGLSLRFTKLRYLSDGLGKLEIKIALYLPKPLPFACNRCRSEAPQQAKQTSGEFRRKGMRIKPKQPTTAAFW